LFFSFQGKEVGLPSKKTADTERAAERLMEAIEVYQGYLEELSIHRVNTFKIDTTLKDTLGHARF